MKQESEFPITINTKALLKLPVFIKPTTYHLQKDPGNGCAGDPPGYPTYYTQSVYTSYGDSPNVGPQTVIFGRVLPHSDDYKHFSHEDFQAKKNSRLRNLWAPLPIDHPRTQAWISATFSHHKHCYQDPTIKGTFSDKILIYPVPNYNLKTFTDDERFSEEWRTKEKASIEQANKEIREHAAKYATPENHDATIIIKRFYPEFQPTHDLINNPQPQANWWERLDKIPKPEECPGQYGTTHPVNGTWCQMCGWHEKKEE